MGVSNSNPKAMELHSSKMCFSLLKLPHKHHAVTRLTPMDGPLDETCLFQSAVSALPTGLLTNKQQ